MGLDFELILKGKKIGSNKISRFFQAFKGTEKGRKGECIPEKCETLSGEIGSACCKFNFKCPGLRKDAKCKVHKIRPLNCRAFPRTKEDLKLVKNCGYYWNED